MKISNFSTGLSILAGLLAAVQAAAGLFWQGGTGPYTFTTLHGKSVQMAGQGLYAFDTYFRAPIFRGTDLVTLLAVVVLGAALVMARRGRLRGKLLLVGVLGYFLYNSASVSLGVAYNPMFLLYMAYFSASLFAFILAFTSIHQSDLAARISPRVPRVGIAVLMFVSAVGLMAAWLPDILGAFSSGYPAGLDSYTTEVTYVFDLGIIVPVAITTGILLLRRSPLGIVLSAMMLVVLIFVGMMVTSQTIFQLQAGITLTPGEFIGKAGSFIVLSLIAAFLTTRLFQGIMESVLATPVKRAALLRPRS